MVTHFHLLEWKLISHAGLSNAGDAGLAVGQLITSDAADLVKKLDSPRCKWILIFVKGCNLGWRRGEEREIDALWEGINGAWDSVNHAKVCVLIYSLFIKAFWAKMLIKLFGEK